jgi:CheY-like chemotaxis protein/anti-sigma regulatory factor (Ser/Thr protein kinase)
MKILVVDDNHTNLALTTSHLRRWGHGVVTATDGAAAVEAFVGEEPDLVLMDLMMPVMDGFAATERIKALAGARWVPVIVLTALDRDRDLVRALQAGADDYLTKPVNFTVLGEKIRVMERISAIQGRLTDSLARLREGRERAEEENRLAQHVMDNMIRRDQTQDALVRHTILPAQHFSGDLVVWGRTPVGELHVMLADATGHGLAAALSVMPVAEVFYTMTAKGFSIAAIAAELNRKLGRLMPTGHFLVACLAAVDLPRRTVHVWNGGCPRVFFAGEDGVTAREWPSAHLPLGILPPRRFDGRTEAFHWEGHGRLFMCSDGLMDMLDGSGTGKVRPELARALEAGPVAQRFDRVVERLLHALGGKSPEDDASLVEVTCPARAEAMANVPVAAHLQSLVAGTDWRFGLRLGAAELRHVDALPFLVQWCAHLGLDQDHRSRLFLILAELYNNALDHGLLGLDSKIKAQPEGFDRYMAQRKARLADLRDGHIDIELRPLRRGDAVLLELHVRDTGPGFPPSLAGRSPLSTPDASLSPSRRPSGRGIALIHQLCEHLEYRPPGNHAVAHYLLSEA